MSLFRRKGGGNAASASPPVAPSGGGSGGARATAPGTVSSQRAQGGLLSKLRRKKSDKKMGGGSGGDPSRAVVYGASHSPRTAPPVRPLDALRAKLGNVKRAVSKGDSSARSTSPLPVAEAVSGAAAKASVQHMRTESSAERTLRLRNDKFAVALNATATADLDGLRALCWRGAPRRFRPVAWKLLLGYLPITYNRRDATLKRKRKEYSSLRASYWDVPAESRTESMQAILRQILVDVPRTNIKVALLGQEPIQRMLERILYIWAIRHPASGYVQGINDLVTPFLLVFIAGEFIILFTVTLCANPANDLTCPPSYINLKHRAAFLLVFIADIVDAKRASVLAARRAAADADAVAAKASASEAAAARGGDAGGGALQWPQRRRRRAQQRVPLRKFLVRRRVRAVACHPAAAQAARAATRLSSRPPRRARQRTK